MRLRHLLLPFAAAALAALPAERAAAQAAEPVPAANCWRCLTETAPTGTTAWCQNGYATGWANCVAYASTDGRVGCRLWGDCPAPVVVDADGVGADVATLLEGGSALPSGVVRVELAGGDVQLRARCSGAVLARAYSGARADALRRETETLAL